LIAGPSEHDGADRRIIAELAGQRGELEVDRLGQRVARVGTVEGDPDRTVGGALDLDQLRHGVGILAFVCAQRPSVRTNTM
jgi:hypothetical protein